MAKERDANMEWGKARESCVRFEWQIWNKPVCVCFPGVYTEKTKKQGHTFVDKSSPRAQTLVSFPTKKKQCSLGKWLTPCLGRENTT